ncbi:hypothetical protein MPSEU_000533800 [Mayamaea pseudoterrestris]|nr:hypothetical protein MPSEU_000533800 [Mayamaea pseudoterrestris]
MAMKRSFFLASCLACLPAACQGWLAPKLPKKQPSSETRTETRLNFGSANENTNNNDEAVRMAFVRSLQMQFYKNCTKSELDLSTGTIYNLPLWRVPWIEVPGRTNVLNVHESHYTNMMETILHSEPPWYVGHLYLPGGSDNIKSEDPLLKLESWAERASDDMAMRKDPIKRAAVLGTLLRISDYRRLQDGRLLVLVQAMERFVVSEVVQTLPYGMAHVQLLPDAEEIDSDLSWVRTQMEQDVYGARALALAESFQRWHRYEFEHTILPLPMRSDLKPEKIAGSALAQVLPFASFSPVVKAETLVKEQSPEIREVKSGMEDKSTKTLERRLIKGHILSVPVELNESLLLMSNEELEIQLWLAINQFLKTTRTPVSPVILGLLPHVEWPGTFVLERIGSAIGDQTQLEHKYIRTSEQYPAGRRQKRFSYCAAALLEQVDSVSNFRYTILALPSTKHRLAYALQMFQEKFGIFQ